MTNTEYRQFLTELEFIGKGKEFSGVVNKAVPALLGKKPNESLLNKRKAYDFMIVNLFKQYGISNDDFYKAFDSLWEECFMKKTKVEKLIHGIVLIGWGSIGNVGATQIYFNRYMESVCKYCTKYAEDFKNGK